MSVNNFSFILSILLLGACSVLGLEPDGSAESLLAFAQTEQAHKNYSQAAKLFTAVLESDAADDWKKQAMRSLAALAREQSQFTRAQQIYAQYLKAFPQDAAIPEILLSQGLVYREMGAYGLATERFYAVITRVLTLKSGDVRNYQRFVSAAQTEIANTAYEEGKYTEAAEFYSRLLKLDWAGLDKGRLSYKLVRSLVASTRHKDVVTESQEFIRAHPNSPHLPELRFQLISSLNLLGRKAEALQEMHAFLQQDLASTNLQQQFHWQQRAGNELGNRLYEEGDYLNALHLYTALAERNQALSWQGPILYQMGLTHERLHNQDMALDTYKQLLSRQKELATNAPPGLKTLFDMAKWRAQFLGWHAQAGNTASNVVAALGEEPKPTLQ